MLRTECINRKLLFLSKFILLSIALTSCVSLPKNTLNQPRNLHQELLQKVENSSYQLSLCKLKKEQEIVRKYGGYVPTEEKIAEFAAQESNREWKREYLAAEETHRKEGRPGVVIPPPPISSEKYIDNYIQLHTELFVGLCRDAILTQKVLVQESLKEGVSEQQVKAAQELGELRTITPK